MRHVEYREIEGRSAGYAALIVLLALAVLAGGLAGHHMDVEGHHVTGMNNRIVWGLPHVFAVFLIVAASGALNAASAASVFGQAAYEPLARLSGVLAIALLAGGLAVLVLDLGRPDRLVVAMTHYNFSSVFAWNVLLYTGFMAAVAVYLWMRMERRMHRYARPAGIVALVWRIVLTTGTGCIFGFLVARQAYDAAIMAPLFVATSFSLGSAVFILVLLGAVSATARPLDDRLLHRLARLQAIFVSVVLYFVVVRHLANLYVAEHAAVERFLLIDGGGGVYPAVFWADRSSPAPSRRSPSCGVAGGCARGGGSGPRRGLWWLEDSASSTASSSAARPPRSSSSPARRSWRAPSSTASPPATWPACPSCSSASAAWRPRC